MTRPRLKLRRGDTVISLAGRDKGRVGEILRVFPAENRAIVRGIHVVKRRRKPTPTTPEGGVERKEAIIHLSNLAMVDPKDNKPTKVGYRLNDEGAKERFSRRTGQAIPVQKGQGK